MICLVLAFFVLTVLVATVMLWKKDKAISRSKKLDDERDERSPLGGDYRSQSAINEELLRAPETKCIKFIKCFSILDNMKALVRPRAKHGD